MTTNNKSNKTKEPRIRDVLHDDLKNVKFKKSWQGESSALVDFYLNEEQKEKLEGMGRMGRWMRIPFYTLKALFMKLSTFRRLLFVVALVLVLSYNGQESDANKIYLNFIIMVFILLLELKDKLLAKSELRVGRQVQEALSPPVNPEVPGWSIWLHTEPANDVGGDLIDYMKIDDNRYGVSLGDVAGKGLGAALLSVKLQSTLRALVSEVDTLSELGERINYIFRRDGLSDKFASLVHLEFSPEGGEVKFLNAGHYPPLVSDNGKFKSLPKGGPAIGLADGLKFTEQTFTVKSGDTIIIYSDGITEARNEKGEFFGEDNLMEILKFTANLTATDIGRKILSRLNHYMGETPHHDDISIGVLQKR